jgi:hypothetical protein
MYGNGLNSYFTNEQAIEANVKTKLLQWVGNGFNDLLAGIDWRNRLDYGQQAALIVEIKNLILNCYGVVSIVSLTANFNGQTRFDSISVIMQTIFSPQAAFTLQVPVVGTT